jgi:2-oxoglutarate dehydrogenase E2 component (dihydrolipoamide succinyltransferase)
MAVDMKIPPVGESITEVTVGTWNKQEGDHVKMDDVLCGLDSDKATFELTAEADGILHILAQEGDVLPIGASICTIDDNGNAPVATPAPEAAKDEAPKAEAPQSAPTSQAAPAMQPVAEPAQTAIATSSAASVVEMKVPAVGESVTEVTIASWSKKDGDQVALDEVLCELESDKATFELPAEAAGILRIMAQDGETLPIGALIAKIETGATASAPAAAPAPQSTTSTPAADTSANGQNGSGYAAHYPSPAAAKILDEKGVNAQQVQGSGVGGRVTKEDAVQASPAPAQSVAPAQPASAPKPAAPAA